MLVSCQEYSQVVLTKILQIQESIYDFVGQNLSLEEGDQIITATKPIVGELIGSNERILAKGSKIICEVQKSNTVITRLAATLEVELTDEQRRRKTSSAIDLPRLLVCDDDAISMVRKLGASFSFFKSSSASRAEALVRRLIKEEEITTFSPIDDIIRSGGRVASLDQIPVSSHLIKEFKGLDDVLMGVDDLSNEVRVLKECLRVLAFWLESETSARKAYQDRLSELRFWFEDEFQPGWREILLCMEISHTDCRTDSKRTEKMINDALLALSELPSLVVSFERKQSSLKPSVLADADSKLVISETKNDLFTSVFDRVIKILAPPAACAVMSSMVAIETDAEKILPKPQAVVVPTQRDDRRRRDGPNTRQNSRRVTHDQTTGASDNVHQNRGRGRGGSRGGSRGRGGQSRGGGFSTLPNNPNFNRGGRGASRRGRVDHRPVVKPKSRSPIRRNDFHRRGEADGLRKKINFDHARRNRSFHSNAGVYVVEEESSSSSMIRSDRVVATSDILSGVEIPKVFSNEELLLARRQFFDDVSAGASRARRLVDVLGIDVDDQRPFDNNGNWRWISSEMARGCG